MSNYSLKRRLLLWLSGAVTIGVLIQAVVSYRVALDEVDLLSDYHMEHMALAIKSGLPPPAMPDELDTDAPDDGFDLVIQAWSVDGERVLGAASTEERLPQHLVEGFSTIQRNGHSYRVFVIKHDKGIIQVTNELSARNALARRLAWRTSTPVALMAPVLLLLVWAVVSWSLRPVEDARAQVAHRSHDDLSPLPEDGLAQELLPFVREINTLFDRIRKHLSSQQQFIADAAHELRSPLAALRLQVQSLQRADNSADIDMASRRLLEGIDRSTRLVEQLLVLARQEASAEAQAMEGADLSQVARLAVSDVLHHAMERQTDLGVQQLASLKVQAPPDALRIALRNLLDNAIKYSPPGSVVDLSVQPLPSGQASVVVEDGGPGIPDDELPRVFDRFFRGQHPETMGSGLGLSIVRTITDKVGATISMGRSQRLGGLRVEIVFPVAATGSQSADNLPP